MTKRSRIVRRRRKGVGNEEGKVIKRRKGKGMRRRRRRRCKDRYDEEEGRRPLICWIAIS